MLDGSDYGCLESVVVTKDHKDWMGHFCHALKPYRIGVYGVEANIV